MGMTCSRHGRHSFRIFVGKSQDETIWGDQDIDERLMLK
jgi:hypothetical protein